MELTESEALLVVILISYYFCNQDLVIADNPTTEGLGEVKLLRRIAREFPSLESNVDLVIKVE